MALGHRHADCVVVADHFSKDLRGFPSPLGFPVRCGRWISPFDPLVVNDPAWPVVSDRGLCWLEYGRVALVLVRLLEVLEAAGRALNPLSRKGGLYRVDHAPSTARSEEMAPRASGRSTSRLPDARQD